MRTLSHTLFIAAFVTAAAPAAFGQDAEPRSIEHPGSVALSHENGEWTYRRFPSSTRLYVHEADTPGKSVCNDSCAMAWPPLFVVNENADSVGDWKVIVRDNGGRQWAYNGRPVYMRFHDSVDEPIGNKMDGWSFLVP